MDRELHVGEAAHGVRVGRADDPYTRAQRFAYVLPAQVQPGGESVDLDRDAMFARDLEDALEVERVLRAAADDAAQGMAQAAHGGVAQRLLHAPRQLVAGHALPAVHAGLD